MDPKKRITLSDGSVYQLSVALIVSQNVRGVPRELRLIEDDEPIQLEEGMAFMTLFVPAEMMQGDI